MTKLLFIATLSVLCSNAFAQVKRISTKVEFRFTKAERLNFTKETRSYINFGPTNLYLSSEVLEPTNLSITLGKVEVFNHESGTTVKKYPGVVKDGRKLVVWATYIDQKLVKIALQDDAHFIIFGYMEPIGD